VRELGHTSTGGTAGNTDQPVPATDPLSGLIVPVDRFAVMTANSPNHLQAVQWRQIGQEPLGNLRQFVVFIKQPNACGVMTHGELSVWLRIVRARMMSLAGRWMR
jgi:hypothetical protein